MEMPLTEFINECIQVSNAHDLERCLEKWQADAVLYEPSMGQIFRGHAEIKNFYHSFLITYNVRIKRFELHILSDHAAILKTEMAGNFEEKCISKSYLMNFKNGKIDRVIADWK